VPGPLETLPSPHERLLAPVPTQFNWLQREVPANPFLEALLSVYGRTRFIVSTSLAEVVSDNFDQDSSREIDARTVGVLGTVYRLDDGQNFVSLANTTSAFYQAGSGESRIGYANLALNAGYQLPPLSFGLTENFSRNDNTGLDTTTPLLGPQQRFLRNSITPQVRYDFSPLTAATLAYTHTLVINEEDDQGNTTTHAVSPGLQHQFSRNLTGSVQYTFTAFHGSDTASSGDARSRSHGLTAEVGYQLDAKTSTSLSAFGGLVDRSGTGAQDSTTYGASIGVRRALFPRVNFAGSAGPTAFKRQGNNVKVSANYQLSLDGPLPLLATPALTFFLSTRQSVQDTVEEVNNVGLVLRRDAEARIIYAPLASFNTVLFVTYSRNEFLEAVNTGTIAGSQGQTENLTSIGVTAAYALTRILSLTGTYRYQRRDANQAGSDFAENRVTIALTGTFPIF
jgi:opacity protein-like surface antigen